MAGYEPATGRFVTGPPLVDRLLAGIQMDPNGGCWLWEGALNSHGYGQLRSKREPYKMVHRLSYEHHKGPIPDGLLVCHKCDVRACVNPDHLFVGTYSDNSRDAVSKGRWVNNSGERHGMAKLSNQQVASLREDLKGGMTQRKAASKYGISPCTVWEIKHKRTRK